MDDPLMYHTLYDVPNFNDWMYIEKINEGLSTSEKYHIIDKRGKEYLLRLTAISYLERKKQIFHNMRKLNKCGIPMTKAFSIGLCNKGQSLYMLLSWVKGQPIDKIILNYTKEEQYQLGMKSGELLRQIHHIKVSFQEVQSYESRIPRMLGALRTYEKRDYYIKGQEKALNLVRHDIQKIEKMPLVYRHGDYKMANMVLTDEETISLIDFDSCKVGDPYEDFFFNEYSDAIISPDFARGKVDGYFSGRVPKEFWEALRIYVAARSLIFMLVNDKIYHLDRETFYIKPNHAFYDYDYFNLLIPKWYISY